MVEDLPRSAASPSASVRNRSGAAPSTILPTADVPSVQLISQASAMTPPDSPRTALMPSARPTSRSDARRASSPLVSSGMLLTANNPKWTPCPRSGNVSAFHCRPAFALRRFQACGLLESRARSPKHQ